MATISVGDAVGEGFSLIRRHPAAVAVWALILLVTLGARIAVSLPAYAALFEAFGQSVRSGSSTPPNFAALAPQLQQAQAVGFLFSLVQLLVNAVLACAIFRAVLRPAESRLAYMRLGAAELFLAIFTIGAVIAFVIGAVIVAIPIGIVAALIGMGSPSVVGIFVFVMVLGVMFAAIYLALRLSLLGPMMVDENQFRLGEAWALTRGKVGSLFIIALLLFVILIVAEIVVGGTTFSVFIASIGGFAGAKDFFQAPQAQMLARLAPVMAVGGLGWLALVACMLPVVNAPWARAYRNLRQSDVAATFS